MAVMRQVGNFAESGALGISIMSRRHATSPGVDQRRRNNSLKQPPQLQPTPMSCSVVQPVCWPGPFSSWHPSKKKRRTSRTAARLHEGLRPGQTTNGGVLFSTCPLGDVTSCAQVG
jgi:hypothetical protein